MNSREDHPTADGVRRVTSGRDSADAVAFERVPVDDLSGGDRILLRPGERVPRDGVLVAAVPERADAGATRWCTVETAAGDRGRRGLGTVLREGERLRGPSVVVEVRRPPIPWWLRSPSLPAPVGSIRLGRRTVLLVLLVLAVAATGVGFLGDQAPGPLGGGDSPDRTSSGIRYQVSLPEVFGADDADLDFELGPAPGDGENDSGADVTSAPAGGATPGSNWTNRATLTNTGSVPGEILLRNVTLVSYENGLTGPERAAGDTGGDPGPGAGEFASTLEIRISTVDRNGAREYVFGGEDSYRPLARLDDEPIPVAELEPNETVQFVVEYRLPTTAGNEIQGDSVSVDFGFTMVEIG